MTTTKQVFLSYAPEDEPLRAKLEKHLSPLERSGKAMIWHAGKLLAGDVGRRAIEKQLRVADVILFLVTPDFLASDTLHDEQLQPALARSETEGARVVPILAKPCAWRASALAKLEPLPRNRTPITLWPHPDEGWADVVDSLNEVLAQSTKPLHVSFSKESEPQSATSTNGPGVDDVTSSERSGVTLEQFVSGRLSNDIRLAFFLEQIGLASERSDFRRAQFETYSDVWRSLQALRLVGDDLWSDASKTNLAAFASQLRKTTSTVREGEIFFEEGDRANLLHVLEEFFRYKFEKTNLVEFDRLSEYFIAKEGYSIAKIREQIAKNRQHKLRYEAILENIRVSFKERLSSS